MRRFLIDWDNTGYFEFICTTPEANDRLNNVTSGLNKTSFNNLIIFAGILR